MQFYKRLVLQVQILKKRKQLQKLLKHKKKMKKILFLGLLGLFTVSCSHDVKTVEEPKTDSIECVSSPDVPTVTGEELEKAVSDSCCEETSMIPEESFTRSLNVIVPEAFVRKIKNDNLAYFRIYYKNYHKEAFIDKFRETNYA